MPEMILTWSRSSVDILRSFQNQDGGNDMYQNSFLLDSTIQRPEEEATTSAAVNVQDISTQDSSDEFEATDTPPIRFRRRGILQERLRLQRRSTEIDVTGSSSFDGPSELNQVGILRWWRNRTLLTEETATEMLVCRSMLLQSTLRRVRRDDFNFCRPFKVNFNGEDGDDLGGPKREFLQLLMSELSSSVLQGTTDRYFFNHNIEKLANGVYEMAGKLFAFSLLHGGSGMPVMHPIVYELIVNGEVKSPLPNVEECVIDMETRGKILRFCPINSREAEVGSEFRVPSSV
ncbi:uncharacterized protein [Argopecten irradians]|uniref:uncharacterized protein n=1 Tax=Argopecten irradians TaxID=31199 RepID=UPI003713C13F